MLRKHQIKTKLVSPFVFWCFGIFIQLFFPLAANAQQRDSLKTEAKKEISKGKKEFKSKIEDSGNKTLTELKGLVSKPDSSNLSPQDIKFQKAQAKKSKIDSAFNELIALYELQKQQAENTSQQLSGNGDTSQIKLKIDSSKTSGINNRLDASVSDKKDNYKNEFNQIIPNFRPSLGLRSAYQEAKNNIPDSSDKTSKQQQFIQPFRSAYNSSSLGGMIGVEAYAANTTLPYQLNENKYLRITATPRVNLGALPFETELYYTTENNTFYNSNSFSFKFDPHAFKDRLKESGEDKIGDQKDKIKNYALEKEKIDRYTNDLERMGEGKLENLTSLEDVLLRQIEKLKKQLEENARNQQNRLPGVDLPSDSNARNKLGKKENKLPSAEIEKLKALKAKYDFTMAWLQKIQGAKCNINKYKDKLESLTQTSEQLITKYQSLSIQDPTKGIKDKAKNKAKEKADSYKKLLQFFGNVEEFDLGNTNPFYSESSLKSIPVRGANIKWTNDIVYVRATGGKSLDFFGSNRSLQQLNPDSNQTAVKEPLSLFNFSQNRDLFYRNVAATKIGLGDEYADNVYIISSRIWDNKERGELGKENWVNGIGGQLLVFDQLTLNAELMYADYKASSYHLILEQPTTEMKYGEQGAFLAKSSLVLGGKFKAKTSQFEAKMDQKGFGFYSLGAPFLRNDYRKIDLKYGQDYWKHKIHTNLTYTYFIDNLSGFNESNNNIRGLGGSAYTNFTGLPNVQITYTPFTQSNNHPDTLFRTNNQFSTASILVFYFKKFRTWQGNWSAGYTRSNIEYANAGNFRSITQVYTANALIQTRWLKLSLNYNYSNTKPFIDSISYHNINTSIGYQSAKFGVGYSGRYKFLLNNGIYAYNGVYLEKTWIKNLPMRIQVGSSYIDKYWNIYDKYIWEVTFGVRYKINYK